jgi:hypothetical protein
MEETSTSGRYRVEGCGDVIARPFRKLLEMWELTMDDVA